MLCSAAAVVGGYGSRRTPGFYALLIRPTWVPPAWLFGPFWTILYLLMALAAWLVWREIPPVPRRHALVLFAAQLVLNAAWSWTFFAWQSGVLSALIITLLRTAIILTGKNFWAVSRSAGASMLPYFGWVTYATALNFALWRANRNLL